VHMVEEDPDDAVGQDANKATAKLLPPGRDIALHLGNAIRSDRRVSQVFLDLDDRMANAYVDPAPRAVCKLVFNFDGLVRVQVEITGDQQGLNARLNVCLSAGGGAPREALDRVARDV